MTGGGQAVLKLRLAVSETYLDRNKVRQERTEWVNCVVWGKRGEALSKFLSKGDKLMIEGGMRTSSFEVEGQKRYRTEVIATEVILCGGKSDRGDSRDDRGASRPANSGGYSDSDYGGDSDDIPF
jgi:single-strand DNA-binding protein